MKKLFALALAAIFLVGCTSSTAHGPCVGIDDAERNPKLVYKVSGWNVAMGIIFVETIVVPIVVVLDQVYCPVGEKK